MKNLDDWNAISAVILTGFIFMLGGCGDGEAESAPPLANMRLLSRMFESMERGDYVSAGELYRKYDLSTEECISPLWGGVIKSIRVIQQVQMHLDAGDLAEGGPAYLILFDEK